MKQLLILSGKGGTGKTTVAASFIRLSSAKAYADCDVDAPNLHLVTVHREEPAHLDYYGMPKAFIDPDKCLGCGICMDYCRYDAISLESECRILPLSCEGCGVCEYVCPAGAVSFIPDIAGDLMLYRNDTVFSTAELRMGSGTSGKLVTEVKKQMIKETNNKGFAVIDGSPGIGCPVIASISGVDMVLLVTEPSVSGISDLERIVSTARRFQTPVVVCTNKFDQNLSRSNEIERFCSREKLPFAGRIPYDPAALAATNRGLAVVDNECSAAVAIREVYQNTLTLFNREGQDVLA